jgi:hypothetical protein
MSKWNNLNHHFLEMVKHPRYGDHAREMVKLIILLREEPEIRAVQVHVEHLCLTLKPEYTEARITVHNEAPDSFVVSLIKGYGIHRQVEDDTNISAQYVPPLIIYHLHRLREKDSLQLD